MCRGRRGGKCAPNLRGLFDDERREFVLDQRDPNVVIVKLPEQLLHFPDTLDLPFAVLSEYGTEKLQRVAEPFCGDSKIVQRLSLSLVVHDRRVRVVLGDANAKNYPRIFGERRRGIESSNRPGARHDQPSDRVPVFGAASLPNRRIDSSATPADARSFKNASICSRAVVRSVSMRAINRSIPASS